MLCSQSHKEQLHKKWRKGDARESIELSINGLRDGEAGALVVRVLLFLFLRGARIMHVTKTISTWVYPDMCNILCMDGQEIWKQVLCFLVLMFPTLRH